MYVDSTPAPNVAQGGGKAQKPTLLITAWLSWPSESVINPSEPDGKQQGEEYRVPVENYIKHMKDQESVEFSTLCLSEWIAALFKSVSGQNFLALGSRTQQSWSVFL